MYRLLWYRPPVSGERKHSREGLLPCAGSIDISRLSLLLVRLSVWRLFIVVLFFLIVHFGLYSLVFASLNVSCLHSCLIFFLLVFGIFVHILSRIPIQRSNVWWCIRTYIYIFLRLLWGPCGTNKLAKTMRPRGIVTHVFVWLQVVQIRIYFVCTVPVSTLLA